MNCSHSSRRLLLAIALAIGTLLLTACDGERAQVSPPETSGQIAPRPALRPGPAEVGNVVEDELAIAATSGDTYVENAVRAAHGKIVALDDVLGLVRARFDVANVGELLRLRDDLRAVGVDARVIPELDPGRLGTGPA